jgi:prepilin signal peptidase PulO-like enzyme (type II secretory pathway)
MLALVVQALGKHYWFNPIFTLKCTKLSAFFIFCPLSYWFVLKNKIIAVLHKINLRLSANDPVSEN